MIFLPLGTGLLHVLVVILSAYSFFPKSFKPQTCLKLSYWQVNHWLKPLTCARDKEEASSIYPIKMNLILLQVVEFQWSIVFYGLIMNKRLFLHRLLNIICEFKATKNYSFHVLHCTSISSVLPDKKRGDPLIESFSSSFSPYQCDFL